MCNILPEVEDCCICLSLRVGMLYISVLAIMSGAFSLSLIEKHSDIAYSGAKFNKTIIQFHTVYNTIRKSPSEMRLMAGLTTYIVSALCYMSILCMLMGVVLLVSTLMGQEGIVQVFVVGMFLLVMLGFVVAVAVIYECMKDDDACLVRDMDWLTGSACVLFFIIYLFLWIYFVTVANSYVVNGDS